MAQSVDVPQGPNGSALRTRRRQRSTKRIGPLRRGLAKVLGIDVGELERRSDAAARRRRASALRGDNLPGEDGGRIPRARGEASVGAAQAIEQANAALEEAEEVLAPRSRKGRQAERDVQWAAQPTPNVAEVMQEFQWD